MPSPEAYKPGALAIIRAAPRGPNGLAAIPADSVGGFVYAGGLIRFTDVHTHGVGIQGLDYAAAELAFLVSPAAPPRVMSLLELDG